MESLKERNCPLCSAEGKKEFIRPDRLVVNRCNICESYFISPAPTELQLANFYSSYFSNYRQNDMVADKTVIHETLAIDPLIDFRNLVLHNLLGGIAGKKMLDVGFGKGQTMVSLKKLGALVSGIDLDEDAIIRAKERLAIPEVYLSTIEDFSRCNEFDFITMYDFIEHPLLPVQALRKASVLLKPGGLLAIDTPNATFIHRETDPVCFRMHLEHMQYFTIKACHYLATLLGMEIVHLESKGFLNFENLNPPKANAFLNPAAIFSRYGTRIKTLLRKTPKFNRLNQMYKAIRPRVPDSRLGNCSIFFILKKNLA
jgi:2-polyprenyl-3-methyl-5-hydroxy-6-metoxy-1,4-benzoquinol methylase